MFRSAPIVVALSFYAAFLTVLPAAAAEQGPAVPLTAVGPHTRHPAPDCVWNCEPSAAFGAVPSHFAAVGERLFFAAGDPGDGGEPWVSDGTVAGTHLLADLCNGSCSSFPAPIGELGGAGGPLLFFWAETAAAGREPWVTDGTSEGTRMLADLCPGTCSSGVNFGDPWWREVDPERLGAVLGGRMLFGVIEENGAALYASDGSEAGTERLAEVCSGFCWQLPFELTVSGSADRLYFLAQDPISATTRLLWVSDGTTAGTQQVESGCWPGRLPSAEHLRPFGGGVAFAGGCVAPFDPAGLNLHEGPASQPPVDLGGKPVLDVAVLGTRIFASRGGFGTSAPDPELWVSDGTPQGTGIAVNLDRPVERLEAIGGGLYLFARGEQHRLDLLYTPDGVEVPVQVSTAPLDRGAGFGGAGGRALWWEQPDELGPEVHEWRLVSHTAEDGREVEQAFTAPRLGPDLATIRLDVPPRHLLVGDDVFLGADGGGGSQLWRFGAAELPPSCFDDGDAHCLRQGRFQVTVHARNQHAGGTERVAKPDAASRQAAGDTGYFWFFRPDNLELAVKVLDGRGVDGHWWVFAGGPTDLEYELTVTDLETDRTRSYHHAAGDLCAVVDTAAFPATGEGAGEAAAAVGAARVAQPLTPAVDPDCDGDRVCLGPGDRFSLGVTWHNQHAGGVEGTASLDPETPDTAVARFFPNGGVEVIVKVLDGRPVNGHWWVLWGGLTDLGYTVEVLDRETETVRRFTNRPGSRCGGASTTAFAEAP